MSQKKVKSNIEYERARQDYINCCEALEAQELKCDTLREQHRTELLTLGTLQLAQTMLAKRMKELQP